MLQNRSKSPPKRHTNVQISNGINVRSTKQQTTPRLTEPLRAVQIAPPVRAGPTNRDVTISTSSESEMLSSTPISSRVEKSEEPYESSIELSVQKEMSDKNISAHLEPPTPIKVPEINLPVQEHFADPPVIIKPTYLSAKSESAVTDRKIDELKGWMQKEFLSRMIKQEQEQKQESREELVPPVHHRKVQSASNFAEDEVMRKAKGNYYYELLKTQPEIKRYPNTNVI